MKEEEEEKEEKRKKKTLSMSSSHRRSRNCCSNSHLPSSGNPPMGSSLLQRKTPNHPHRYRAQSDAPSSTFPPFLSCTQSQQYQLYGAHHQAKSCLRASVLAVFFLQNILCPPLPSQQGFPHSLPPGGCSNIT